MPFPNKIAAATGARRAALCALLAASATSSPADPADYVFTPYSSVGQRELAYGVGTARGRDGSRETQQTLGLAGMPSARWYSAVYAAWAADDGGAFQADEWAWTNHLQLTTAGESPLDAGLLCDVSRPHDRTEGRLGLACGPTLQMDSDDWQLNVNPRLGKRLGAAVPEKLALDYQWQARTLVAHGIEVGAQGFGSVGAWNHWSPTSQQSHTIGPAIFLKTRAFGGPVRVDAGFLLGIGEGSPRNVVRLRLEQEF